MSLNGCSWLLCFEVGLIQSIVAMGKLECQLHIDHDLSPNLGDGLVDDSAFLDAVGRGDALKIRSRYMNKKRVFPNFYDLLTA